MDTSILAALILWAVFGFFILLRTPVHLFARILSLVFLAVTSYVMLENPGMVLHPASLPWKSIFHSTIESAFHGLIWLWPVTLIYAFYASSDRDVNVNITILSIFSLVIWLIYFIFI